LMSLANVTCKVGRRLGARKGLDRGERYVEGRRDCLEGMDLTGGRCAVRGFGYKDGNGVTGKVWVGC
jgi:hypothetical protein